MTETPPPEPGPEAGPPVAMLLLGLLEAGIRVLRGEWALARVEVAWGLRRLLGGLGLMCLAVLMALAALGMLAAAAAIGLRALGLPPGWAELATAGIFIAVAAILGWVGLRRMTHWAGMPGGPLQRLRARGPRPPSGDRTDA